MARRGVCLRGRRGISVVIATVILVAVAITVAVSVAFWMGGITGQYTRMEKLQVLDPVQTKNATAGYWNLTFTIKNVGSTDATIDNVFINGLSIKDSGNKWNATWNTTDTLVVEIGKTEYTRIDIGNGPLTSGTTIEVKFHTASGMEYPKMVTLI